eukprot:TRINITY_DN418_c1_g1_i1.p1 TRINITY_DN418_c1_g1~~TRINITY_DN418_c1_g1_i1.p1  ORF type:complete len:1162 (+),score=207.27 TRINITY_DN418_c1_g1_i1:41-3526(+)
MPLPADSLCYFRHPEDSWLWGKVVDFDPKKKYYKCKAVEEGNSQAPEGRAPQVLSSGPWADGWPDPVPKDVVEKIPDNEKNIFSVREDVVYSTEYEDTHDLLRLTILHDSTLLSCIKKRYFNDIIYTFIGAIVVAVNPFNYKIPWYTDDNMNKYLEENYPIQKNLPHSWACAHNTYHELRMDKKDQTILVSGESGAGKTEASKIVLKYLSAISSKMSGTQEKEDGKDVRSMIMAASPFLEAFGNAKTSRNDNSSRFGKFMQIKFSEEGAIVGANITKYLLEKSRIVTAGPGERVYHSLYLAVRGNGRTYGATSCPSDTMFKSLNAGGCVTNNEFNSGEDFDEVCDSMKMVGIDEHSITGIWSTLAGVLHLSNISFEKCGDGCVLNTTSKASALEAAKCLFVDPTTLCEELVRTIIFLRGEKSEKKFSVSKAVDSRDAFVKRIYDQVFSSLVVKCNEALDVPEYEGWIGLLDIFGFEHFEVNSFEQLCINTANEVLQGNYNQHIFAKDMDECRAEGVDVTEVKFPDNTECINLVISSKPKPGLFSLLDSSSTLSKGDPDEDAKWLAEITSSYEKHKFFEKKRLAKDSFIVKHFAGDVSYTIKGFVEKNADTLKEAWKDLVISSSNSYISSLAWPVEKKLTVAGFFKQQLLDLMKIINSSNPHWIRCVKPHPAKKPMLFDGNQVAFQLTTSGVLATVSIRKAGYPVRLLFGDFNKRYRVLFYKSTPPADVKARVLALLQLYGLDDKAKAQIGVSRVFLKQEVYVKLEEYKRECTRSVAIMAQATARVKITRLTMWRPVLWLASCKKIQEETRGFLDKSREQRRIRANLRQLREQEGSELLARCAVEESYVRFNTVLLEEIETFGIWIEKVKEEIKAEAVGLLGDEGRGRNWVASQENAERNKLDVKMRWSIEMGPVLQVELKEEVERKKLEDNCHTKWLRLLQVWTPMRLFELELGRGSSERYRRRLISDEETSARRTLKLLENEGVAMTQICECAVDEEEARCLLTFDEGDSWLMLRRSEATSSKNATLSTYLSFIKGTNSSNGTASPLSDQNDQNWWSCESHPSSPSWMSSSPRVFPRPSSPMSVSSPLAAGPSLPFRRSSLGTSSPINNSLDHYSVLSSPVTAVPVPFGTGRTPSLGSVPTQTAVNIEKSEELPPWWAEQ